ncbi:MAG: DUF2953 domain-containing protein [Candidatus Methanoperedens sp.]|nr:DUF2953 domain-containing protein [Candidatus Methanoperedens sp.]
MIGSIIIILAALAILLAPMTISINSANSGGKIDGFFSFCWIMLMFRYKIKDKETEILILGRRVVRLLYKEKSQKSKDIKKSGSIKKSKKILHLGYMFDLSRPMLRLFKDLIHAFRLKYLNMDLTFGFNDPAHTGILAGFLQSIFGSFQAAQSIRWRVDFTRSVLEWDMKAEAAIMPIHIFLHMIRFLTSRQVLKSGYQFIRD